MKRGEKLVLPRQGEVARARARDGGAGATACKQLRRPLSHRLRDDSSPYRESTNAWGVL